MADRPTAPRPTAQGRAARPSIGTAPAVRPSPPLPPAARLDLQPVVHVADMAASVAFYERLGGEVIHGRPEDDWVLLQLGALQLHLVATPAGDRGLELNVTAAAPLADLGRDLPGARPATHHHFGPHLLVRSPDGLVIRINQREPDAA